MITSKSTALSIIATYLFPRPIIVSCAFDPIEIDGGEAGGWNCCRVGSIHSYVVHPGER